MAFSSFSSHTCNYDVFVSSHVLDVPEKSLRRLCKQLNDNGISVFDDGCIKRGETISPEVTRGIRESKISIVVLSKNYASSSWCLNELVEIIKCREEFGHVVIPVFYGVDPSDVQKQTGEFGIAFNETCADKTEEEMGTWSQVLIFMTYILGAHFLNRDNVPYEVIEEIAVEVSKKLNAITSMEFEDMVGLEAHMERIQNLLRFDEKEVRMVGIVGPRGIGKTTVARALFSRLSNNFQHTCFMDTVSYNNGLDDYLPEAKGGIRRRRGSRPLSSSLPSKLVQLENLQSLSKTATGKMINQFGTVTVAERLRNRKVLIILDNVNDVNQLKALAKETKWFAPGSRIIVTTEDKELLRQHGINNTYKMDLPAREEALKILCICAFGQTYPHNGFKELAERVVELTGNLPLHLSIVGSFLRGEKEEEWEEAILRLESNTDHGNMDAVLSFLPEGKHRISEGKHRCSTYIAFLVIVNLLVEFVSAVADQLSSTKNPCFSRISLVMSVLSVVLTILDLGYKIRTHEARFRCKWPVPWFYYPSRGYNRIFGNFTDTVLLFCVVGGLIVSTVNWSYIEKGQEGPIKISVWPLFFSIGMVGSKFMEKPVISRKYSLKQKIV